MRFSQILQRAEQIAPQGLATIDGSRERTWINTVNTVRCIAGSLRGLGVNDGARVAILGQNSARFIELMFGVSWAGGAFVPLNTRWSAAEIAYAITECQAGFLFCDESMVGCAMEVACRCPEIKIFGLHPSANEDGLQGFDDLAMIGPPLPAPSDRSGPDLCAIFFTGGTTGHPKGVCLTHENVVYSALNWVGSFGVDSDTVYMHVAGFFHLGGSGPVFATTLAGGTNVVVPKFEPVLAAQTIERHAVNYTLLIPVMLQTLLNDDAACRFDLSSVRNCHYGGAPMPDALLAQAMDRLPTWQFIQGYGQTESTAILTSLQWKDHLHDDHRKDRRLSVGCATYGWEVRIVDEAGQEVPRGTVGEIVGRSPAVSPGYWGDTEPMADGDGWLHTGDAGRMNDEGFIFIVDRLKDMIVTGGENVFSAEVENAIYSHPKVLECAVFGIPHDTWGETVHAVVVRRAGETLSEDELIAHLRTRIAGYKTPRSVTISQELLPRSAAGKVTKNVLREPFWSGRDRRVN